MDPFLYNLLYLSELKPFLDKESVLTFSFTCRSSHIVFIPFIERYYSFNTPLFSVRAQFPGKFLKKYPNAKRVNLLHPPSLYYNDFQTTLQVLPASITHSHFGWFSQHSPSPPSSTTHLSFDEYTLCDNLSFLSSITHLYLPYGFQRIANLPSTLKYLCLNPIYTANKIPKLPLGLKVLICGYNGPLEVLPSSLTHLYLNCNQNVDSLPPFLTHLRLLGEFNQNVNNLPSSLLNLKLGDKFNQSVDNLPSLLARLTLGFYFNQHVNNLPKHLTHLYLKRNFNQSIDKLPRSLTHLALESFTFTQSMQNLPPVLIYFKCRGEFKGFEKNVANLPTTIRHLELSGNFIAPLEDQNLPPNLHSFSLYIWDLQKNSEFHVDHLPLGLTTILFCNWFNQPVDSLPPTLLKINFGSEFDQPVDYLPPSLHEIGFGNEFDHLVDHLPPFLTHLFFGRAFNQYVDNLPPTLTHLGFESVFNYSVDHLPPSLKHLSLRSSFNQNIDHLPSIIQLHLGPKFNQSVDHLPNSLKKLVIPFGSDFNHPVDHLPPLEYLYMVPSTLKFSHSVDWLPSSLTSLELFGQFPSNLEDLPNLGKLTIGGRSRRNRKPLDEFYKSKSTIFPTPQNPT